VLGAGVVFKIHDADELIAFYDNGHGPLSQLLLWLQGLLFLVLSDFMLYWLHRLFHGGGFWKYHAIHHSSEELDWISAARFHPANLFLGTIAVDVILLMAGISPNIMLWVGPFTTFHIRRLFTPISTGRLARSNMCWQLRCSTAGITHRWKRAAIPTLPGHFRSGISFLEPIGCRKTDSPKTTVPTISAFRPRLSDSWPTRFVSRFAGPGAENLGPVCSSFTH
jgi:hypothetical protein